MNIIQKDKELLLKDLSARLPYNCRVFYEYVDDLDGKTYGYSLTLNTWCIDEFVANKAIIKPYLRPLSSMTEEEERKRFNLGIWKSNLYDGQVIGIFQDIPYCSPQNFQNALIWLLQNHFDIFGLIPKGLAIEVTEENNPYK